MKSKTGSGARCVVIIISLLAAGGCDVLLCLTTGLCAEGVGERDSDPCALAPCGPGERCEDGLCFECRSDAECESGICQDERCVECRSDAECPDGFVCDLDFCTEGCFVDDECGPSALCIGDGREAPGTCAEVACAGEVADPACTTLSTMNSIGYLCSTDGVCADADDVTGCSAPVDDSARRSHGGPLLLRGSLTRVPDDDTDCNDAVAYAVSFAAVASPAGSRLIAAVRLHPADDAAEAVAFASRIEGDQELGDALVCLPADGNVASAVSVIDVAGGRSNTVCLIP
jgi:Cys-rich repeat protein